MRGKSFAYRARPRIQELSGASAFGEGLRGGPGVVIRCLGVHTEALHDDRVWRRLQVVAKIMAMRGSRATFFVYPFRAFVADKDILDRVKTLAALGHEIGQHTHFYSGRTIEQPHKGNNLREDNIRSCIQRDHEYLCRVVAPEGFTAGGWLVPDTLYATLIDLGFKYDCSARVPALQLGSRSPHTLWLEQVQIRQSAAGSLTLFPTTHTVSDNLLRRRRDTLPLNPQQGYQLIYLHDYDLLRWPVYATLVSRIATGQVCLAARALNDASNRSPHAT